MSEAGTFQPGTGTVRLGIIGAGIMGERLLRAAAGQDRVQVAGLWDPAPEAVARLGAELPGTPFLRSAAAVIEAQPEPGARSSYPFIPRKPAAGAPAASSPPP